MYFLFYTIFGLVILFVGWYLSWKELDHQNRLFAFYWLFMLLPTIAVGVRRLHDTNRNGWWVLLTFAPAIGQLAMLYFFLKAGQVGDNQYGPDPQLTRQPQ